MASWCCPNEGCYLASATWQEHGPITLEEFNQLGLLHYMYRLIQHREDGCIDWSEYKSL